MGVESPAKKIMRVTYGSRLMSSMFEKQRRNSVGKERNSYRVLMPIGDVLRPWYGVLLVSGAALLRLK